MVKQIKTKADFDKELKDAGGKLVVVDFTATWCGPCKQISPVVDKLAELNKDVVFIKVDVDENQETSESCGIKCMPTFQFYKNCKLLEDKTLAGADEAKLTATVAELK